MNSNNCLNPTFSTQQHLGSTSVLYCNIFLHAVKFFCDSLCIFSHSRGVSLLNFFHFTEFYGCFFTLLHTYVSFSYIRMLPFLRQLQRKTDCRHALRAKCPASFCKPGTRLQFYQSSLTAFVIFKTRTSSQSKPSDPRSSHVPAPSCHGRGR